MSSYPWENIKKRINEKEKFVEKKFKIIVHPYDLLYQSVQIKETLNELKLLGYRTKYQKTSVNRTGVHAYEVYK
jgi:hypothetical protein